jgi:hypothetical protein
VSGGPPRPGTAAPAAAASAGMTSSSSTATTSSWPTGSPRRPTCCSRFIPAAPAPHCSVARPRMRCGSGLDRQGRQAGRVARAGRRHSDVGRDRAPWRSYQFPPALAGSRSLPAKPSQAEHDDDWASTWLRVAAEARHAVDVLRDPGCLAGSVGRVSGNNRTAVSAVHRPGPALLPQHRPASTGPAARQPHPVAGVRPQFALHGLKRRPQLRVRDSAAAPG